MRTLKFSTKVGALVMCQVEYLLGPIFLAAFFMTGITPLIVIAIVFLEQRAFQLYFNWLDQAVLAGKILDAIEEAEKDESAQ